MGELAGKKDKKNAGPRSGNGGEQGRGCRPSASEKLAQALAAKWYAGAIRSALREATGQTDKQLDELLASPEAGAAIERMWQVILREASLDLLVSIVARAEKESSVAKLATDLCGIGGVAKPGDGTTEAPNPDADFSEFERAILDNLRAAVNEKARLDG